MSASEEMTRPRVVRDLDEEGRRVTVYTVTPVYTHLLMRLPSFSREPWAPVLDTLSLPAKSTKLILDTFSSPVCEGE